MNHRYGAWFLVLGVSVLSVWTLSQRAHVAETERTASVAARDASITMRIKTTYLFNPHLSASRINVDTNGGRVTLKGSVAGDVHRDLAVEIAKNAEGVVEVRDELRVVLNWQAGSTIGRRDSDRSFGEAVNDATLTASIKLALAFGRGVKATSINVDTLEGTVTLSGLVRSEAERQLAERIARERGGVERVVNLIEVHS